MSKNPIQPPKYAQKFWAQKPDWNQRVLVSASGLDSPTHHGWIRSIGLLDWLKSKHVYLNYFQLRGQILILESETQKLIDSCIFKKSVIRFGKQHKSSFLRLKMLSIVFKHTLDAKQ